ncbi:hypothetical protein [Embleya sp. NPDC059237]|uniref:hypothetical protein n=1 Tax=Embleya sp. NPDC059237 TaxID=3346784 RepID=UPI0036D17F28
MCADAGALMRVTLAPDRASVTSVVPLLPANDRANTDATLAPDGNTVLFLSRAGSGNPILYRIRLDAPGAVPIKVADMPVPEITGGGGLHVHLVAAQ